MTSNAILPMRLGNVIGRVTLTQKEPVYAGGRLLLVQPWAREQFAGGAGLPLPKGASVVVYDELGADLGCVVGFTEGAEAAQPFTGAAPVDAYCACIVDHVSYTPPDPVAPLTPRPARNAEKRTRP